MIFLLLLVLVKTALGQDADQVNRWSRTSEKGLRFLARDSTLFRLDEFDFLTLKIDRSRGCVV